MFASSVKLRVLRPRPAHKSEWPPTNNGLLVQLEKRAKTRSICETLRVRTCDTPDGTGVNTQRTKSLRSHARRQLEKDSAPQQSVWVHARARVTPGEAAWCCVWPSLSPGSTAWVFCARGRCGVTHYQIQPGSRQASGVTHRRPRALLADLL